MTLDDKLEDICPFFYHLYALLGERANVALATQGAIRLPDHAKIYTTHRHDFEDDFFDDVEMTHTTAYKNSQAYHCTLLDSSNFLVNYFMVHFYLF